jgi:L-cysteine S-thiosulfotransferase
MRKVLPILAVAVICLPLWAAAEDPVPKELQPWPELIDTYQPWQTVGDAIPAPLGVFEGNPDNGLEVAVSRSKGNCVACHVMPIPAVEFHGELGPSLVEVGKKFSAAQLRLRVVDIQKIYPRSVMPAYYLNPNQLHRVAKIYLGRTILTAQEVEDVVAYLTTLK